MPGLPTSNTHDRQKKTMTGRSSNSSNYNNSSKAVNSNTNKQSPHKTNASNLQFLELQKTRQQLPIYPARDAIVKEIINNDVVVIVGETGSGKSTQIPQYILSHKLLSQSHALAITQPRRVAAISIAKRVADEVGCKVGEQVGHSVRFSSNFSHNTLIKYLTDGMLLRELLIDPLLSKYRFVIVDEAHERSVRSDLVLGIVKMVMKIRNNGSIPGAQENSDVVKFNNRNYTKQEINKMGPLKVIVMSATLDAELFAGFFTRNLQTQNTLTSSNTTLSRQNTSQKNAKIIYVSGRLHPIKILHTAEPQEDYLDSALTTIMMIHMGNAAKPSPTSPNEQATNTEGDILVFLPGQDEILSLMSLIHEHSSAIPGSKGKLWVLPLFANMPAGEQGRVFEKTPKGVRKVILSTNIAETSITIPGIRYVIDTGVQKTRTFHPRLGIDTLQVTPISKSSARQRAGRAGRESPGVVYRLYTLDGFRGLEDNTTPEILRTNLSSVVLQLKAAGVEDILNFEFIEPPSRMGLEKGLETLFSLGALNTDGELTELGVRMSKLPITPELSKVLLTSMSDEYGCTNEVVSIISVLSGDSPFVTGTRDDDERESKFMFASSSSSSAATGTAKTGSVILNGGIDGAGYGDHILLLNMLRGFVEALQESETKCRNWCKQNRINYRNVSTALEIRQQLVDLLLSSGEIPMECKKDLDLSTLLKAEYTQDNYETIAKCFLSGFIQNTAIPSPSGWKTLMGNKDVYIHPGSILFGKKYNSGEYALMFDEVVASTKPYARTVTLVRVEWLRSVAAGYLGRAGGQ